MAYNVPVNLTSLVDEDEDKAGAQTSGLRHKLYILRPELVDGFVR